jgi:ATPase subunit of ABC transporter with duplicated ATPase domains
MLLEVGALKAWYGASQALFGVDLAIAEGEVVALMGRNGMGKTTTIRASPARTSRGKSPSASRGLASGLCRKAAAASPISPSLKTCSPRRGPANGRSTP